MAIDPVFTESTYPLIGANLGPFLTAFPYAVPADVEVWLTQNDAAPQLLATPGDYTLAGTTPLTSGGQVTLAAGLLTAGAWPDVAAVALVRATPRGQPSSFGDSDGFSPAAMMAAMDNIERQVQELTAASGRAIQLSYGDAASPLALAPSRAGKVLMFDAGGAPVPEAPEFIVSEGITAFDTLALAIAADFGGTPPNALETAGYSAAGDWGKAGYVKTGAPGAGPQYFTNVGGQAYVLADYSRNIRQLGAKGNALDPDQAALQAAFDAGGYWFIPPGAYRVSGGGLAITKPVALEGVGAASLLLPDTTNVDVIHAYPGTGPNLQGLTLRNFSMYATAANPTAGALVHLDRCNGFRVEGCSFQAYYGGLLIDGSVHGFIDCDLQSDANFTHLAVGSYLAKFQRGSDGTYPAEIHINKPDWRGQNGNFYLDFSVLITAADGIWFHGPHLGFARVGMALNPLNDASQLTSVIVEKGYLDTCSLQGLQAFRPSPTYSAAFGLHDLDFANVYNTGADGIQWFMHTPNSLWSTLGLGNMLQLGATGLNIGLGEKINVKGGYAIQAPANITAGSNGITLQGTVTDVNIGRGVIEKGTSAHTPSSGIQVTAGVTNFIIDTVRIRGCTNSISDTSGAVNKQVAAPVLW